MDNKVIIGWIVTASVRGAAWLLAGKLGLEAAQSQSIAEQIGFAVGALITIGVSIYSSVKARKTLRESEPPAKTMQP